MVLSIALALAGCGGGSGGETAGLSKADFIKKATAVCQGARRRIESEFAAYSNGGEGKAAQRAVKAGELTVNEAAARIAAKILIPSVRRELAELRALGLPESQGDRVKAMLDSLQEGIEKAEAHPERAARDSTEAFGRPERLIREYGIGPC